MVAQDSLLQYRQQLISTIESYEASLRAWNGRRKLYTDMLQLWSTYGQLRENPVDKMRLECMLHLARIDYTS